ncbi:MAG: hypothetical protein Q9176_006920 [Flavoplaca citrina]
MSSSNKSTARRPTSPYALTRLAESFFDNLPRLPTPPPVTQCCPWNKPCAHSILTLENEPITRRFLPIPAAETRFLEARRRHAESLLPPPAPRLNPLGVIGDPPSLVLDSNSDADGDGSVPETPRASNRGNDANPPFPKCYYSHAHPSPTSYATDKAVPGFATSTPNNLATFDLARRIRETRLQRKYVRYLDEDRRRHVTRSYRITMTYWHMARCEQVRRAREEEEERRRRADENRRIVWLKDQVNRARTRTMAERTELQQELEMLLQARKGR